MTEPLRYSGRLIPGWVAVTVAGGLLIALLVVLTPVNLDRNQRQDEAMVKMQAIDRAIRFYQLATGEYPTSLTQLVIADGGRGPLLEGEEAAVTDPWGRPFQFEVREGAKERVVVWTTDPNGQHLQWPRESSTSGT